MTYVFHQATRQLLDGFIKRPRSSVLISGRSGSGRTTAINYLLEQMLGSTQTSGQLLRLNEYNIDGMRQLLRQLSRTRQAHEKIRLAVIDDVDRLQLAAQTVLLKTLEEPPTGSHFILSAQPAALPATIVSRCQPIRLKRPAKADLFKLFKDKSPQELENAYLISDGWSGDMVNYLLQSDCPLNKQVDLAKSYLKKDVEARTIFLVNKANQELLDNLLEGLLKLARAALRTTASKGSDDYQLWLKRSDSLHRLREIFPPGENRRSLALAIATIF